MEGDRLSEGREVRWLLAEGISEGRHDHLEAGRRQQLPRRADADGRSALHVPGAVRACRRAEGQARLGARRGTVDRAPLPVDEYTTEAVRQSQGAPSDRVFDQQGGARQGCVQRLRDAGRRRGAARRAVRGEDRRVAVRRCESEAAVDRGGLPERLRDRALVGIQP